MVSAVFVSTVHYHLEATIRFVMNLHDSFDIEAPLVPKKTFLVVQNLISKTEGYLCSLVYM